MLERDLPAVSIFKLVKSDALLQAKAAGVSAPRDEMTRVVIDKHLKNCQEAMDLYHGAGRTAEAEKQANEMALLRNLLPAQLTGAELELLLDKVLAETRLELKLPNFGKLLEQASALAGLSASRADLARSLKERLEA